MSEEALTGFESSRTELVSLCLKNSHLNFKRQIAKKLTNVTIPPLPRKKGSPGDLG